MKDGHYTHSTNGRTCSQMVEFDVQGDVITNVKFTGGCKGNTQGVSKLAEGMKAEEIVTRLKGIDCRFGQSCPNELAMAVEEAMNQ